MESGGSWRPTLIAAAVLTTLACAYTWPLAAHLRGAVPHDRADPLLVTWILWWSTNALPLTDAWWNAPAFYPATGVLAFSENLLGLAPIAAPMIRLTGDPLLAYNVCFFLSYVLCGLGAYALGFVLTARHDAAFVAAVAFAFAPYRLSHAMHLQVLSAYWMPIALAALHVFVRGGRVWAAIVFASAWMLQSLVSGYYLFFLSLLVALWLAWFAPGRLTRRHAASIAMCWLIAAALLAPVFLGYRAVHERYGLKRSPAEIEHYSADLAGIASASRDSLMWPRLHAVDGLESEIFPGVTIALLAAGGCAMSARRRIPQSARGALLFYLAAAALMWLLALGPRPALLGKPLGISGPYAVLLHLPGFDEMRVPARLWILVLLCLSAVAALVVAHIAGDRTRRVVVGLSAVGLLLDGWPHSFTLAPAPELRPARPTAAIARLDLPLSVNETESMYQTIGDGLPVFNGYSGYEAPQHAPLRDLLERHDPAILRTLAADGAIQIVVEHELDPDRSWRDYVERTGARLVDATESWTRFELARQAPEPERIASGSPVAIQHAEADVNSADVNAMFDGDPATRWYAPQQHGNERVTLDLGSTHTVRWVVLSIGTYASQYPRSLAIETSTDGVVWSPAWSGRTALAAYRAAVREPRAVPMGFPIDRDARFLRLRQTADETTRGWTIVEVRVLE